MGSFTAIAGWVADVPAEILALLYTAREWVSAPRNTVQGPSKTTLWRVLTGVEATAVDTAIGAWLAEQAAATGCMTSGGARPSARRPESDTTSGTGGASSREPALVAIAVDGKTLRGAIDAEGRQKHLLAAATHGHQLVLGQVEVDDKSNEIPMFAPLIDQLADTGVDLSGWW